MDQDPDPGGPKTYSSRSGTLLVRLKAENAEPYVLKCENKSP
jgi:hypothetical protein